jgi:hypothetical protein
MYQTTDEPTRYVVAQPPASVVRRSGAGYVGHAVTLAGGWATTYTGVPDALDEQLWPGTGWVRMPDNPPVIPAPAGTACNHCGRTGLDLTFWPPTTAGEWTCANPRGCWCTDADCCGGE